MPIFICVWELSMFNLKVEVKVTIQNMVMEDRYAFYEVFDK